MAIKRLTQHHPTMKKLEQLMTLADELGIKIDFLPYNTIVNDKDYPGIDFYMDDNEKDECWHSATVSEFPYPIEYKLTYKEKE